LTAIAGLTAGPAPAATWRVEQDGSGDWQTLQQAADAAATGDTILVGPGRYYGVEIAPGAAAHYQKSLTFIGENVDSVVVGPVAHESRTGMRIFEDAPQHFRNLTFANLSSGIEFRGGSVENCRFVACTRGVDLESSTIPSSVTNCTFTGLDDTYDIGDALYARNVEEVLMEDCQATDMMVTAYFVESCTIRNCRFPKTIALSGLKYYDSNGLIENCVVSGYISLELGTLSILRCDVSINDSYMYSTLICSHGEMLLEGSVVHGGADGEPALMVGGGGWVHGSGNDILKSEGSLYAVFLDSTSPAGNDCDLRNNYWGTSDADTLRAWMRDADDDPGRVYRVLFEPFSSLPLPSRGRSLGSVKAMFR
jgi:hypothetical protein